MLYHGHLPTFHNEAEKEFFVTRDYKGYWFGYSRNDHSSKFFILPIQFPSSWNPLLPMTPFLPLGKWKSVDYSSFSGIVDGPGNCAKVMTSKDQSKTVLRGDKCNGYGYVMCQQIKQGEWYKAIK